MKVIQHGQELMIISEEGVVIRVKSSDISQLGRATQGVKVMNVADTDRVTAIARVATSRKKVKPEGAEEQSSLFSAQAEAEVEEDEEGFEDEEFEEYEIASEDGDE
jgi:DNA gyrase subunit A